MNYKSYQVYDNQDFFDKYTAIRKSGTSANDLLEKPIINQLVGTVKNKVVLDLGCGDGLYGKELLNKGAQSYLGIDGSKNMYDLAKRNLKGFNAELLQQDIENIELESNKYDLIISRLVFHYIQNPTPLLKQIQQSLTKDGTFVLSIEHPIITSCYDAYHKKIHRTKWIVDNYFSDGERINNWNDKNVIKYHKTIEQYWKLFQQTDFVVNEIRESKPIEENYEDGHDFKRRLRVPLFMMFGLGKT